jgi:23S rRNA pseudouridine2605 synthase
MEERLQKIMATAGVGSRRHCDALIAAGRVTVNGRVAVPGAKADPAQDQVAVDGKLLRKPEPRVYIALYKPRGVLSTVDAPDPRPTVRDLVPIPEAVYPVGRLDYNSEGLILMTNDGDLTERLTHPRYGHEKEYRVLVASQPDEEQLAAWRRGVILADGFKTSPAQVSIEAPAGKGAWLRIILREGHKRQIRETGIQIGLPVQRIVRVRIASLRLGRMKPKEWRYLSNAEVKALKDSLKEPAPGRKSTVRKGRPSSHPPRPPRKQPAPRKPRTPTERSTRKR